MKEKSNYNTKEEAVEFLMNETNLTYLTPILSDAGIALHCDYKEIL